jgi:hypothetical protein
MLILTTFPATSTNEELSGGIWRPLNMQAPPFNFSEPIDIFTESSGAFFDGPYADKSIGFWDIATLPTHG